MLTRRELVVGALSAGSAALAAPASLRAQAGPVRIGVILPMSGVGAELGPAWLQGIEIAAAQWNRSGGLLGREIELVVRDDKYSSSGSVTAGRELAGMGINLLIGGSQSPMALGLAPLLSELKAVCVAPTPAAMSLTHENFQRNFFRLSPNAYMLYAGLAKVVAERNPDISDWAGISFDSEYGRDTITYFQHGIRKTAAAAGRKVTFQDTIYVPPTKADLKVEINGLMNTSAQGLYIGLIGASCISFLQQARSVGLNKKFKIMCESGTDLLIGKAMQKSTPTNLWSVSYWFPEHDRFKTNPISANLYNDYTQKTGDRHPMGLLVTSYRSSLGLFNAVKKAGSTDTEAVISALEGLTFDTIVGPYTIRKEDHQGYGTGIYAKVGPRNDVPFYGIDELTELNESTVIEPPTPGKKFVLPE